MSENIQWLYNELTEMIYKNQKLLNEMKAVQNPSKEFLIWIEKLENTIKNQETKKENLKVIYGL